MQLSFSDPAPRPKCGGLLAFYHTHGLISAMTARDAIPDDAAEGLVQASSIHAFDRTTRSLGVSLSKTVKGERQMSFVNHSRLPLSYCQLLVTTVLPATPLGFGLPEQSRSQVKRG